jgi:S1-C subfamily serine protease
MPAPAGSKLIGIMAVAFAIGAAAVSPALSQSSPSAPRKDLEDEKSTRSKPAREVWTEKVLTCGKEIDAARSGYMTCITEAFRKIVPYSIEPAGVVADAVMGLCAFERGDIDTAVKSCPELDPVTAKTAVDGLDQQLRSVIFGRIVQRRAEERRAQRKELPPADVKGDSGPSTGTAFIIMHGLAITNLHIVDGCRVVEVNLKGAKARAAVLSRDAQNDLAVLGIKSDSVRRLAKPPKWRLSLRQGEDVIVFGFPLADILAPGGNVTTGVVTALAGVGNDPAFFQLSAPVQPGSSGGPVLDRGGNLIGIVVAKLDEVTSVSEIGAFPQNVNFAVKASHAVTMLENGLAKGIYEDAVRKGNLAAADEKIRAKWRDAARKAARKFLAKELGLLEPNAKPLSTVDITDSAKTYTALVTCIP